MNRSKWPAKNLPGDFGVATVRKVDTGQGAFRRVGQTHASPAELERSSIHAEFIG